MRQRRKSCTVKGHSQFGECKTKRQSTLHLQNILWGRVMEFVLRVVHENWIVLLIVSAEGRSSLHLSCVIHPSGHCVQAYWWLWVARLWKILQQHWYKRQCSFPPPFLSSTAEPREQVVHPTPRNIHANRKESSESAVSHSRQYKRQRRNISQFTSFL